VTNVARGSFFIESGNELLLGERFDGLAAVVMSYPGHSVGCGIPCSHEKPGEGGAGTAVSTETTQFNSLSSTSSVEEIVEGRYKSLGLVW
jgi:hypothetical protein